MGRLRSLIVHPITIVFTAAAVGIVLHRMSSSGGAPREETPVGGTRVSRTLPAEASPAAPPSETAPASAPRTAEAVAQVRDPATPPEVGDLEPVAFGEVWGYLMDGEEKRWDASAPLSDVGLFNFRLGDTGKVIGRLDERTIELVRSRGARAHLVIASSGQKSLLHFLLNPNYRARNPFVGEIAALARRHRVDGLQLDFESILAEDRWHFVSFLEELRALLPEGMLFSLALPARYEERPDNALRYRGLAELADRFFIMVYDEHWKGGRPGSIASKGWHDRVVAHVLEELPAEKVVIGLPFYGRIWQRETVARATRYPELAGIVAAKGAEVRHDLESTHHFTFTETVTAECWFEDAATLHAKFAAARALGARSVGFWRLGQEDPRVWGLLRRETGPEKTAGPPGRDDER